MPSASVTAKIASISFMPTTSSIGRAPPLRGAARGRAGARLNRVMTEGETRSLRVGISACLLGEPVRYDGGHKREPFLTDVLGKHVEWVAVCPEVELGLGVPRPPIDFVEQAGATPVVGTTTGEGP